MIEDALLSLIFEPNDVLYFRLNVLASPRKDYETDNYEAPCFLSYIVSSTLVYGICLFRISLRSVETGCYGGYSFLGDGPCNILRH
jgi:hypothetical protein